MFRRVWILAVALAVIPAAAHAQGGMIATGIGPRVGFTMDPDQFTFGGQVTFAEVAPRLSFDPNLEIGFGDHLSVIALNADLHYHFDTNTTWVPYAGGGLGINFISFDNDLPNSDDSTTEIGANIIVGVSAPTASGNRFFGEFKFGLGDIPEAKLMAGWNFKM
ncbi:MAG: hypothetical protein HOP12_08995 [Candidatus Eisenbacteria bacterium]|uniref:Porin family protein n=1 Tax=Eiseniibacteriota bacterium TaxID=2212470 RepID=A0A849SSD6_UNCEI|nr:hypothetical protein [Candidatus Eisenbacteria bacterium]